MSHITHNKYKSNTKQVNNHINHIKIKLIRDISIVSTLAFQATQTNEASYENWDWQFQQLPSWLFYYKNAMKSCIWEQ